MSSEHVVQHHPKTADHWMQKWLPFLFTVSITLATVSFGYGKITSETRSSDKFRGAMTAALEKVVDRLTSLEKADIALDAQIQALSGQIEASKITAKLIGEIAISVGETKELGRRNQVNIQTLYNIARANQTNMHAIAEAMRDKGTRLRLKQPGAVTVNP